MPRASKSHLLNKWAPLLRAVRLNKSKLAVVGPFLGALERAYADSLFNQKAVDGIRESLKQAMRQRNESLATGYDASISLRNFIKSVLGPRAEELNLYGMKPRPKRSRRARKLNGCELPS